MKIGQYIYMDEINSDFILDIGGKIDIKEEGTLFICLDLEREVVSEKTNVIPCFVVSVLDSDEYKCKEIDFFNYVFVKHKFS